MEMLMKPQLCVSSNATDDYLRYLRQMNISHCFVMFRNEETNYDAVNRTLERVRAAGLTVDDAGNGFIYKHPSIQLGLPDRDEWIAKYNDLNRWLGNAGVKVGYATWDTGRVSTSWWKAGEHTHGAMGRIVDMNEIYARKPAFGKEYDYDTMWNNFEYFLRAALPVCKEVGMKLALHPCDPPVRFYEGCASIIISGDDYRKALRLLAGRRRKVRQRLDGFGGLCAAEARSHRPLPQRFFSASLLRGDAAGGRVHGHVQNHGCTGEERLRRDDLRRSRPALR